MVGEVVSVGQGAAGHRGHLLCGEKGAMARTGKRARKRHRSIDIESPLRDAIPTTFALAVGRLTDLEGSEEAVVRGFAEGAPDVHDLLSRVYDI